ncbi:solute carrier family 25 member 44-like isoform X1 [Saccoglossus kowalevskii]|uniref:Solute carrier family 25 member 44-like n=1 Tax=Saccoglossus kowalevskii TaxID=10224 RepID=A0ABM0M5X8_SACKO|nr:PREDICTED: solute carrier family 25 member 44-like [Saccoglossus kowalevskii]
MTSPPREAKIIEWDDMDKRKFYGFGFSIMMGIRAGIYPTILVKTRLQVQKHDTFYKGTWDAFKKIIRYEGMRGLYRGFMVNAFTVFSGQCYITTYELTRTKLAHCSNFTRSFVAGGAASLIAQSITVPCDVVSQLLMMQGQTGDGRVIAGVSPVKKTFGVIQTIWVQEGVPGFYRGYLASLLTFIPNSALWWPFYHFYWQQLVSIAPSGVPFIALQAVAGPAAGMTSATLTNPMDIIRTRLQVSGGTSIIETFNELIKEDGMKGLTKGLTARYVATVPTSFMICVSYEFIKRISLKSHLAETLHW